MYSSVVLHTHTHTHHTHTRTPQTHTHTHTPHTHTTHTHTHTHHTHQTHTHTRHTHTHTHTPHTHTPDTHTHTHTTHTHRHTHTNEPQLFSRTPLSAVFVLCSTVTCDCPPQPFPCPRDSILVERRLSSCCVQYECVCPHAACPVLAECDSGVQPVPMQRGHGYPGYCCPQYQFEGVQISYTYVCV